MVAAFPLGKLLYLGIKQVSKPISRQIQKTAIQWPLIRRVFLIPPAQFVHRLEVFVKMRLMGAEGPTYVKPLSNDRAAQIGAEMMGEAFVYSVAASVIMYEYFRSKRKEDEAEEKQDSQIVLLKERLDQLNGEMGEIKNKIERLEQNSTKKKK